MPRDDGLVPRSARGAKRVEEEELKAMQPPPDAVAEDDVPAGFATSGKRKNTK